VKPARLSTLLAALGIAAGSQGCSASGEVLPNLENSRGWPDPGGICARFAIGSL